MKLKNYSLQKGYVQLHGGNRICAILYFNQDSGKVFYRSKIGTLSDVKHAGIFLGVDRAGNRYFMHNHYKTGRPAIVSQAEFAQGSPLALYEGESINTPLETIRIGLEQVMNAEPYTWHSYNCQTFVNHARSNKRVSEDVNRWMSGLALVALVALGIKVFND